MPAKECRVLFVCLGNICRSPMAEAVFKSVVKARKLEHIFTRIDSCGTSSFHIGSNPDSRSSACCNRHGVPVDHRARQLLSPEDFQEFTHILCMDRMNYRDILAVQPPSSQAVVVTVIELFGTFSNDGEIEDPYYGDTDGFERNFQQCKRASEAFINHILEIF